MAVTGVNNYSNIYTNAYTGNIRKNNAKENHRKAGCGANRRCKDRDNPKKCSV